MQASPLQHHHDEEAALSMSADAVAQRFLHALNTADHQTSPYDYWLLDGALDAGVAEHIAHLSFGIPQGMEYGGRRECNNGLRLYFTPDLQARIPLWKSIADGFKDPRVTRRIEEVTGTDLTQGQLRIEYCQDSDGFWLEPHVDIKEKLFSMSIYVASDPALSDAGTDIYDDSQEHNLVATSPYNRGAAMIFIPGKNTWHGFSKRPIRGIRKSLIVNYVTPDWRAKEELA